ncbi:hypothetical protein HPC38_02915 [Pasteurellaceae bacterium HPA106]|uniref:CDP-glycerol glycerophosphotransferase family protein n=1 Tax=Spirabiliibacterium pneumoniae TaxID=221400 RepID=UPI001AADAB02|nr:CDP-glycerol glycerophosphotransferase family protein [Spirabiliibacterium pneumoniae]MBE2895831.1 hypothetical protein [Spirabiliibacterium pneumoniae]
MKKDKRRIIFNSTRNEYYNFNSKYLFEYFLENYPEYDVYYVINDFSKRVELKNNNPKYSSRFIETESISGMWFVLKSYCWVCSALELPVGGFFQKYTRMVFHVGHGAYFRSAVFLEKELPLLKRAYYNLIKYNFTHHLVTSNYIALKASRMFGCSAEQVVVLGEPMNDPVFNSNNLFLDKIKNKNKKNVLYMPTWRPDSQLKIFPFDDINLLRLAKVLEEHNINIFLRLHPSFEEDLSQYTNISNNFSILDTSIVEDVNEVIGFFDLVITDYSSGHLGFLLTEKPLMFLPYDLESYNSRMGFLFPYDSATPGPKPKTQVEFIEQMLKLLSDKNYFLSERIAITKIFHNYRFNNSKMVSDFIIRSIS